MHNRQELMDAICRRKPARVPYTYTAREETDRIVRKHLGIAADATVDDYFECNRFDSFWNAIGGKPSLDARLERLKSDDPDETVDIWGVKRKSIRAGDAFYLEVSEYPLAGAESVADIEKHDWPSVDEIVWPELPRGFDIGEWKKDHITLSMPIGPFGIPWSLRGLDRFMMDLALNPEMVEAMVQKTEEYTLGFMREVFERYPGAIDLVGSGDDYGTQNGLLLSADMIAEFFMPSLRRHYDLGRKHGAFAYHHCCGAIFDMIPLFIEAGLNVLNPIQTSARGMDPIRLKREFGSALAFHGAIDIQQTLVTGSPADVRAEVRSRIDTLGPAGYILCPSHTLQPDTPVENVVAMYEEAREYGAAVCR